MIRTYGMGKKKPELLKEQFRLGLA